MDGPSVPLSGSASELQKFWGIATLQRLNLPQQWPFCRAESDVLMARRPASGALERNHLLPGGCTDAVFEVPGTWFEQGSPLERRVWWECKVLQYDEAHQDGGKGRRYEAVRFEVVDRENNRRETPDDPESLWLDWKKYVEFKKRFDEVAKRPPGPRQRRCHICGEMQMLKSFGRQEPPEGHVATCLRLWKEDEKLKPKQRKDPKLPAWAEKTPIDEDMDQVRVAAARSPPLPS